MSAFSLIEGDVVLRDQDGNPVAISSGSAVGTTRGFIGACIEGTTVRFVSGDASGRQRIVGAADEGDTVAGSPLLIGGTDTTNVRAVRVKNTHPLGTDYGLVVRDVERTVATYYAVFDRIAPAANKYMATLFNTSSTRKIVVQRVWRHPWRVASVSGSYQATLEQYIARITARTAGTSVTVRARDTGDSLSAGMSADTNSSAVTEDHIIRRFFAFTEPIDLVNNVVGQHLAYDVNAIIYQRRRGERGITLRQNQGITIRNVTSETKSDVSYVFEFTDEGA